MTTRRRERTHRAGRFLDYVQAVLDETRGLIDDEIDRLRRSRSNDDDYDELVEDIEELRQAMADLNARFDRLPASGR